RAARSSAINAAVSLGALTRRAYELAQTLPRPRSRPLRRRLSACCRSADGLGRLARGLGGFLRHGLGEDLIMVILTAHRMPEVAQPASERASHFGKPLRAEHQQRDHEDEQQVRWLKDVPNHLATA